MAEELRKIQDSKY